MPQPNQGDWAAAVLETWPQQVAPAQVAGLVEHDVEQPDLFQVAGEQRP